MADNLADKFEEMADAVPGRIALVSGEERVTFAELDARANRVAHHLADNGVGPGAAVGLVGRNSIPFVVAFLGCFKLRAVPVNVNHRYVAGELAELFLDSDAVALVVDGDLVDECARALALVDAPEPHHVVVIGDDVGPLGTRAVTYDAALTGPGSSPARDFGPRSGDDVNVLYTGGTTGRPKGVVWRQQDTYLLTTSGAGTDAALAAARDDPHAPPVVVLPAGPFVHSSSQWVLIGALIGGRTTVVLDRFDPATVWDLCEQEGVHFLAITGDAMARPLLDALGPDRTVPESIRSVSSSGGSLSPVTKAALARILPHATVFDALGATETGLLGTSPATPAAGSAELRVTGTSDTIVVDDEGHPVGPGRTGMLAKTGCIPLRYHKDPEKTARTFLTHGGRRYAISGDVARVERDGTITVLGRQSSCINTGGEKVYPHEVESVLKSHPAVEDCLVVGIPDERWGQRVCALVAPRSGHTIALSDLQAHARRELAGYKVPRAVCVVARIERQPSGKPDYRWANATALAGPHVES